jgi:uncharacterized membrane protein YhaH (DUF805 family)
MIRCFAIRIPVDKEHVQASTSSNNEVKDVGSIGIIATNLLTVYQLPLRIISLAILVFALYMIHKRLHYIFKLGICMFRLLIPRKLFSTFSGTWKLLLLDKSEDARQELGTKYMDRGLNGLVL